MTFTQLSLSKKMLETLIDVGFDKPTKIQEKVIPHALIGKDIIGQAHTGTGKTAAFSIPIVEKISEKSGLQAIILAPSRELAIQIYNELQKIAAHKFITIVEIIGGISYDKQKRDLKKNPEIIVATPGRFVDHMTNGLFNLKNVTSFVLDEADEMLSFGFLKEIQKISNSLPSNKQTYFLTATFNKKIKALAESILKNPIKIAVSDGLSTSNKVEQKMIILKENQKFRTLVSLLQILKPEAAMVFGKTRKRVDELTNALQKMNFKVIGIQGDMRQKERSASMKKFRSKNLNILVGTDVMARGIDIEDVDYVFNFDLPNEIEYYTHRIGRTGRAGKKGISISFVKEGEVGYFREIIRETSSVVKTWPMPSDSEISSLKNADLQNEIEKLYQSGKKQFEKIGKKIAEQHSIEKLGIIVANLLVGSKTNIYDIKLTGESGVNGRQNKKRNLNYQRKQITSNNKKKQRFNFKNKKTYSKTNTVNKYQNKK